MKYKFDCHVCGESWRRSKREISKDSYLNPNSKDGRPMLACPECRCRIVGTVMG